MLHRRLVIASASIDHASVLRTSDTFVSLILIVLARAEADFLSLRRPTLCLVIYIVLICGRALFLLLVNSLVNEAPSGSS